MRSHITLPRSQCPVSGVSAGAALPAASSPSPGCPQLCSLLLGSGISVRPRVGHEEPGRDAVPFPGAEVCHLRLLQARQGLEDSLYSFTSSGAGTQHRAG